MRRIAEQEGAPLAEMLRHPVMHLIGREPVHLFDVDLEVIDRAVADVLELELVGMIGPLVPDGSDQARPALPGQGKDGQKIGLVEVDVQLAVERRAGGLDIGDVEDLSIGAAGKACPDRLAHERARAVAAGDVARLADFLLVRQAR